MGRLAGLDAAILISLWLRAKSTAPLVHGNAARHPGVDRPGRAELGDVQDLVARRPGRRREPWAFLAEHQHAAWREVSCRQRCGPRQQIDPDQRKVLAG